MKVKIITEGGKSIGLGHIMRCLSINNSFNKRNIFPEIIINGDESILETYKNTTIVDWISSPSSVLSHSDVVIVDSYLADDDFYCNLSSFSNLFVSLDDFSRIEYPNGIVVNGSIYADSIEYRKDNFYLIGPKYAPMREAFCKKSNKTINEKIEKVLITFGGTSDEIFINKIIELILQHFRDVMCNVVFPRKDQKSSHCSRVDVFNCINDYKMKELMLLSDVCISAGGTTIYELANVGVPSIGVCLVDNQENNLTKWSEIGFLRCAGRYNDINLFENIKLCLDKLSYKERVGMSELGIKKVDGLGSDRIVNAILKKIEDKLLE